MQPLFILQGGWAQTLGVSRKGPASRLWELLEHSRDLLVTCSEGGVWGWDGWPVKEALCAEL